MEFQIKQMAYGRPQVFVEANSGDWFLMGKELGCEINGATVVGGTLDAFQGYNLVANGNEREPVYYLDAATVTALKATIATGTTANIQ